MIYLLRQNVLCGVQSRKYPQKPNTFSLSRVPRATGLGLLTIRTIVGIRMMTMMMIIIITIILTTVTTTYLAFWAVLSSQRKAVSQGTGVKFTQGLGRFTVPKRESWDARVKRSWGYECG